MPPTPRRPVTPPARPVPPAASEPPGPPPQGPNGGNGEPMGNTIDPEWIYAEGITAADALSEVLGDRVTGNNQTDGREAIKVIEHWRANMKRWEALIYHLMFNDYSRRGDHRAAHQRNNWVWVAGQVRLPLSTVATRAHAVECHDCVPADDGQ